MSLDRREDARRWLRLLRDKLAHLEQKRHTVPGELSEALEKVRSLAEGDSWIGPDDVPFDPSSFATLPGLGDLATEPGFNWSKSGTDHSSIIGNGKGKTKGAGAGSVRRVVPASAPASPALGHRPKSTAGSQYQQQQQGESEEGFEVPSSVTSAVEDRLFCASTRDPVHRSILAPSEEAAGDGSGGLRSRRGEASEVAQPDLAVDLEDAAGDSAENAEIQRRPTSVVDLRPSETVSPATPASALDPHSRRHDDAVRPGTHGLAVRRSALDPWQTVPGSEPLQRSIAQMRRRVRARKMGRTAGFTHGDPAAAWERARELEALDSREQGGGSREQGARAGTVLLQDSLNFGWVLEQVQRMQVRGGSPTGGVPSESPESSDAALATYRSGISTEGAPVSLPPNLAGPQLTRGMHRTAALALLEAVTMLGFGLPPAWCPGPVADPPRWMVLPVPA